MTRRRRTPIPGFVAVLATLAIPAWPVAGQETLLERWSVGYLTEGWSPRGAGTPREPTAWRGPTVNVHASTELLSLRQAFSESRSTLDVALRQRLTPAIGVEVAASSGAWSTEMSERPLLTLSRSQSVAVRADARRDVPMLGETSAAGWIGWDRGTGGGLSMVLRGARHTAAADAWRAHARDGRVSFPADSLREVGSRHDVWGGRVSAEVAIPLPTVVLRPGVEWHREVFDADSTPSGSFLDASPTGSRTSSSYWIAASSRTRGVRVGYRAHDVELASGITRGSASAGRLPVANLKLSAWAARGWLASGPARWMLSVGRDDLAGTLSTRVETWPFVDFWGSISAQAYRLSGDLDASSTWVKVGRSPEESPGWGWEASAAVFDVRVNRDSWYVTNLGFGRSDRVTTVGGAESAVFVGGGLRRSVDMDGGAITVAAEVAAPVYARELGGATASPESRGLAGYFRLTVDWSR